MACAAITLEELLMQVGVRSSEKLNECISDDHLRAIALFLPSWPTVATYLGLSEIDVNDIERDGKNEQDKRLKALQKWKGKFGFKATYRKLVEVLLSLAMADVAEKVCHLLKEVRERRQTFKVTDHTAQQSSAKTLLQQPEAEESYSSQRLSAMEFQLQHLQVEMDARSAQVQQQFQESEAKLKRLQKEQREDGGRLQAEVEARLREKIDRQQRELKTLRATMDARSAQVQQQLQERDAEINRLQRELRDQTASRNESVAMQFSPQKPQKNSLGTRLIVSLVLEKLLLSKVSVGLLADSQYYDILLIGTAGIGKSTTANKLLGASEGTSSIIRLHHEDLPVTHGCEVLVNKERKVRVLNVSFEGDNFHGSWNPVLRWLVQALQSLELELKCVVYFLPTRGALERGDGMVQKQLKVLYECFSSLIFEIMVVVATNHHRRQVGFSYKDKEDSQHALCEALKSVTEIDDENILCPLVVYIAINDTGKEILDSLRAARVKRNEGMSLVYQDDTCAKCNIHIRYGKAPGSKECTQPYAVDGNGKYKESKCHPQFRKKKRMVWSPIDLLKGWPNSTNSDECVVCKRERGSPGCRTVDGKTVDHLLST